MDDDIWDLINPDFDSTVTRQPTLISPTSPELETIGTQEAEEQSSVPADKRWPMRQRPRH